MVKNIDCRFLQKDVVDVPFPSGGFHMYALKYGFEIACCFSYASQATGTFGHIPDTVCVTLTIPLILNFLPQYR